jgi:NADPH2:quinone reductase
MQAIRVMEPGGPEVLELHEVPDLEPGAGEVVVDVRAVGVNPVDTYIRSGTYAIKPQCPYTPGMDGAGEILKVGSKVKEWSVGDRVYIAGAKTGTYAQQALCFADQVHPLPAKISFAQGAAVYVAYATAYRALFQKAHAKAGEWVLVHGGSGGVGIACVQWARLHGLHVVATAGTARGEKLLKEQGVEYVLNHREPGYQSDILGANCGRGLDIIIEMLANVNLGADLGLLAQHGRVVVVGNRGTAEINPRDIMAREAIVTGMTLMNAPPDEMMEVHAAIVAGLQSGALSPVVGAELPLAQAALAHEQIIHDASFGKIVLMP